jgi:hypothetical protein
MAVTRELLTREDFFDAVVGGEGVIVVVDDAQGRTAHPVSCPTLEATHEGDHALAQEQALLLGELDGRGATRARRAAVSLCVIRARTDTLENVLAVERP